MHLREIHKPEKTKQNKPLASVVELLEEVIKT